MLPFIASIAKGADEIPMSGFAIIVSPVHTPRKIYPNSATAPYAISRLKSV